MASSDTELWYIAEEDDASLQSETHRAIIA